MALWIKFFEPGAQHPYGQPASIKGCPVGHTVNAQCQTTGDDKSGAGQAARKCGGSIQPWPGGASAADDCQLGFLQY